MPTGGGDAPGLNGVKRAVMTKRVEDYRYQVHGLKRGRKRETRTVPEDFYEVVETFFG